MTFHELVKKSEKPITDNSPAILTAIGVTGTLTTAYLTGKATFKAAEILQAEFEEYRPCTTKEKAQFVWKLYIPAARRVPIRLAVTIAVIVRTAVPAAGI